MSAECMHHPLPQDVDDDSTSENTQENTATVQREQLQKEDSDSVHVLLFEDEESALLHQSCAAAGGGSEGVAAANPTTSIDTGIESSMIPAPVASTTPPSTPTNPLLLETSLSSSTQQQMPLSPPPLHPPSPWNTSSSLTYDPTYSYNRRRRAPSVASSSASGSTMDTATVVSAPAATASTTLAIATTPPARPRRQHYNNLAHVEEREQRGLRASLDAGFQAMRQLVRSSSPSSRRSNARRTQQSQQSQSQQQHVSIQIDDDDDHHHQYHRQHYHQQDTARPLDTSFPQTPTREPIRQRTQSEPDAARLRDFHLDATPQQPQQPSSSVRRRHLRMRAFTEDPRSHHHHSPGSPQLLSSPAAAALSSSYATTMTTTPRQITTTTPVWSAARSSANTSSSFLGSNSSGTPRGSASASNNNNNTSRSDATHNSSSDDRINNNDDNESNNNNNNNNELTPPSQQQQQQQQQEASDRERHARMRWVRINRRFQLVITIVAILFSLLLFAILICWVVLTSAYIVSFEKSCAVPLQPYFWLVTFQLVLDVFRNDIMRLVFHWDANLQQGIPCRVVVYNVAYLIYAMMVLRLGILSVFVDPNGAICEKTAPELYRTSAAFVSLSIAAWATIICGYLLPFCVVAIMLTCNGYNPSSPSSLSSDRNNSNRNYGHAQPVFPAAYSSTGAPAGCIELIPVVSYDNFPADYPSECCICMEEFRPQDVVVETGCKHIFHKSCCQAWLLQARSCPVCRTDIPSNLEQPLDEPSASPSNDLQQQQQQQRNSTSSSSGSPRHQIIPMGPTGRPVRGLLQILHHSDSSSLDRHPPRVTNSSPSPSLRPRTRTSSSAGVSAVELSNVSSPAPATVDLEEGRGRLYGRSN